jgi:hypothetical protein
MPDDQSRTKEERQAEVSDKAYVASRLAIKAGEAYMDGDIPEASRLYKRAGDLLVECVPLQFKAGERDFIRVLAASNYFKGGHYRLALYQVERVKPERMKKEFRGTAIQFKEALKERMAPNYSKKIAKRIKALATERKYEAILTLLSEHPYALPPNDIIRLRFHFANLAGLLSPEEIAAQMGVDLTPDSDEAKEAMTDVEDPRFKLPSGMRRSVVTGELEPDPDYKEAELTTDERQALEDDGFRIGSAQDFLGSKAGAQASEVVLDNGSTMTVGDVSEEEKVRGTDVFRKTMRGN